MTRAMAHWRRIALGLIGVTAVGSGCGVYGMAEETRLMALDSQTGRMQWSILQLRRGHHGPQVVGDRLVVSQSNYDSSLFSDIEPMAPDATGKQCVQRGWSLTAYDTTSGRKLWAFCPQAQQFPALDIPLTHGMQFQLTGQQLYAPLLMSDFPPGKDNSDRLLAINSETGVPAWSQTQNFRQSLPVKTSPDIANGRLQMGGRKISSELFGSSVVAVGQQVVVLTGKLNAPVTLQSFNGATGKATWKKAFPDKLEAEFISSIEPVTRNYLLANQQQVFLVSPRNGIIGLDPRTGTLQFQTDGAFWGRTRVMDTAFYQFEPAAVSAYATTTGKRQWRQAIAIPEGSDASALMGAVDAQTVYARVYQQQGIKATIRVLAFNRANGQLRWQTELATPRQVNVDIPPVVSNGGVTLIAANPATSDETDLQVVTLDAQTGQTRWSFPLKISGDDSPVVRVYGLLSSNSRQVFVRDRAPRFHHWLTRFR